ncbi:HTH-type transcriptional regulator TtgR [compost metagenome]
MQDLSADCDLRIAKALRNAVNRGQLPADLDCRRAAISLHAYMEGLQTNWLLVPAGFSLAEEAENLVNSVMDMLRFSLALRVRSA